MSGVLPGMSLTNDAKFISEEKWAEHVGISIVSPGKDENEQEKNQDRIMLMEVGGSKEPQCQLAIVCDGVTPSPLADVAAEYVSNNLLVLFQEGGLRRTADVLREMRLSLVEKSLKMDESQPGPATTRGYSRSTRTRIKPHLWPYV